MGLTIFGIRGTFQGWVDPTIPISAFGLTIQKQVSGTVSLRWLYDNISDKYWSGKTSSYRLWEISYPREVIDKLISMGKRYIVVSGIKTNIYHYNYATPESEITVFCRYSIADSSGESSGGKNGAGSYSYGPRDIEMFISKSNNRRLNGSSIVIKCEGFSPRASGAVNITYSLSIESIYFK